MPRRFTFEPNRTPRPRIIGRTPYGRPIVLNDDGTMSTELKAIVQDARINNGQFTVIPTMFGGNVQSIDDSIRTIVDAGGIDPDTNQTLPGFPTLEAAGKEESRRAQEIERFMAPLFDEWEHTGRVGRLIRQMHRPTLRDTHEESLRLPKKQRKIALKRTNNG